MGEGGIVTQHWLFLWLYMFIGAVSFSIAEQVHQWFDSIAPRSRLSWFFGWCLRIAILLLAFLAVITIDLFWGDAAL